MRKSSLECIGELSVRLDEFTKIVNLLERRDSMFLSEMLGWTKVAEESLRVHGFVEYSRLSAIRGQVISARSLEERRTETRKAQGKVAADLLDEAQTVVFEIVRAEEASVQQGREIVRQLLLIVIQSGAFTFEQGQSFPLFVEQIWQAITSNSQLRAAVASLRMRLGPADIMRVLYEEVDVQDFSSLPAT